MALGGGNFVTQNKKLPGAYTNFVSATRASATLSDRGIVAIPMAMSWGEEGKAFTLTSDDLIYNSMKILGYEYTDDALIGIREAFKHSQKVIVYRLNTSAVKATNTFATAKFGGVRGNDLKIVVTTNVDDSDTFDVKTLLGLQEVDVQTGKTSTDDLVENDFVTWKSGVTLTVNAGTPLTSGTDGTITTASWQAALADLENESFNTLGVASTDDDVKSLAVAWTKRMRDEVGMKFQTVVYDKAVDYLGVINLVSTIEGATADASLVYWVAGAQAGCAVNKSCTNMKYDGELTIAARKTQQQLENCIDNGQMVFHKVGDDVRLLTDINSKTTVTSNEGEDFKSNQIIRLIDQIANDDAVRFNTQFLGVVQNNKAGRVAWWNETVKHRQELQRLGAIEDYLPEHTVVEEGDTKKSVVTSDSISGVSAMERLYLTVVVS